MTRVCPVCGATVEREDGAHADPRSTRRTRCAAMRPQREQEREDLDAVLVVDGLLRRRP